MASQRLTSLPNNSTMAAGDLFYHVDVSDTTDGVAGTSKSIPWSGILSSITLTANDWSGVQRFNSTGFAIKSGGGTYYAGVRVNGPATADRVLTITIADADTTLSIGPGASVFGSNTGDQAAGTGLTGTTTLSLANMAQGTVKGRAAGAGTGAPGDLTATQIVAILPDMGPAGGGHFRGMVPDPGATLHGNDHYFLRDNGTWQRQAGQCLGSYHNAGNLTSSSTVATILDVNEKVTFTLDAAATVLIFYHAHVTSTAAASNMISMLDINGTSYAGSLSEQSLNLGWSSSVSIQYSVALAAGTYTVRLYHWVNTTAATGVWNNRTLSILRVD